MNCSSQWAAVRINLSFIRTEPQLICCFSLAGSMKPCLSTATIGVGFDSVNDKPVLNSLSKSSDIPQTKMNKYLFRFRQRFVSLGFVCVLTIWQYGLWSFPERSTKLEIFLHKNQNTQMKLLNFEFWINGELSKSAKIWLSKSIFYVKNHLNLSQFFFIEEYQFRSTLFVIDIFWLHWFSY